MARGVTHHDELLYVQPDHQTADAVVLVVGVLFFFAWDLAGVGSGIFFRGETSFMTGIQVAPEIPLEEIFFLALLCYLTMNVYGAASSRLPKTS